MTGAGTGPIFRAVLPPGAVARSAREVDAMKVLKSLRSAKTRHKDCRVVRRKGKVYVINKTNPRFKARQG